MSEIRRAQQDYSVKKPTSAVISDNDCAVVNSKTWVSDDAEELQWILLIIAHCGYAGNRGIESTGALLKEEFIWSSMDDDTAMFVSSCIHGIMY